ncbi:MAG TPA: hypothetical protein DCF45_09530 [Gammaproteobacteria bacterium]|nr:hypothetical protein [Gammaproteobacteria bacterium]
MTIKKLAGLFALALFSGFISAAELPLVKNNAPQEYVVKKGDSLWKIADMFLQNPWLWPSIWQNNNQIENPHLIYPGDLVTLVQTAAGPRLLVNGESARPNGGEIRLSPEIISESVIDAVPVIPLYEIAQFLERATVISDTDPSSLPYVLSGVGEHVITGAGDQIYGRQMPKNNLLPLTVYRLGDEYLDPDTGELLGHAALYVGLTSMVADGDPAKLLITQSRREILPGDILLPTTTELVEPNFKPTPASANMQAKIIDVVDGVSQIGQYNVVVLNRGLRDGLNDGHTLRVMKHSDSVYDNAASEWVALPDEHAGTLLVFKSYEKVSFGLILSSTQAIQVNDRAIGGAG